MLREEEGLNNNGRGRKVSSIQLMKRARYRPGKNTAIDP
jgi:hypothetical protein